MAAKNNAPTSMKHIALNRANAQMVAIVAAASFATIFCLVAAKAAFSENRYQAKVSSAEGTAQKQLQTNLTNYANLKNSYNDFDAKNPNIIHGNPQGTGDNDGKNTKIILDALPDKYDFPALASSLEKILVDQGLKVTNITGIDDQVNQETNLLSATPKQVSMPFSFTVSNADYASVNRLILAMERSVRPLPIDSLSVNGGASNMTIVVNGHTYYQPSKDVNITKKAIK